jgi:hypothetical protein
MPTPHHRPRNVKLTNNLTAGGDAGARKEARFVLPFAFPYAELHRAYRGNAKDGGTPHHETSTQAASRALARMVAAGQVAPVVVRVPPPSKWNPNRPRKSAPHHKPRNVRLTGRGVYGSSTAADMTEAKWASIKNLYRLPQKQKMEAFVLAARGLKRLQQLERSPT